MEIRPSDKKLVALGLTVGAAIALAYLYRRINKKGCISYPTKTETRQIPATAGHAQNPPLVQILITRTISEDRNAPIAPPTGTGDVPEPCDRQPEAPPLAADPPPAASAPAVLSTTRWLRASVVDALIVFFACCIFVGTSGALRVNAPIDRVNLVILVCSMVLIAVFYAYLFKIGGGGTPGAKVAETEVRSSVRTAARGPIPPTSNRRVQRIGGSDQGLRPQPDTDPDDQESGPGKSRPTRRAFSSGRPGPTLVPDN